MIKGYLAIRLRIFFSSQKPLNVLVYVFLSLYGVFSGIKKVCRILGYNISPYSYPHLIGTGFMSMLILVGLILVFIDAPFLDDSSRNIISRLGRKPWFIGSCIYIFIMSCLYSLLYNISLIIGLRGYQSFILDWGKVITTLARSMGLMASEGIKITYKYNILDKFEPVEAMIHSNLISILEFTIVGLIIFVVSLYFKSNWQGIVAGLFYIMMGQITYLAIPGFLDALIPVNFLDISVFENGGYIWSWSLSQGYMILVLIIVFLIILGLLRVRKMDIDL